MDKHYSYYTDVKFIVYVNNPEAPFEPTHGWDIGWLIERVFDSAEEAIRYVNEEMEDNYRFDSIGIMNMYGEVFDEFNENDINEITIKDPKRHRMETLHDDIGYTDDYLHYEDYETYLERVKK